jgi:Patatin-like phospholipase
MASFAVTEELDAQVRTTQIHNLHMFSSRVSSLFGFLSGCALPLHIYHVSNIPTSQSKIFPCIAHMSCLFCFVHLLSQQGRPLKVLTIDGGGVRGIVPLAVLQTLEKHMDDAGCENPKPSDWCDLIVGSGTGGILAILLGALQLSVQDCVEYYKEISTAAFQTPKNLAAAKPESKCSVEQFETLLQEMNEQLGYSRDSKLSDFPPISGINRRPRVVVLGSRSNNDSPFCFTNFKCAASRQHKQDEMIWKVLRAASATPTFFPPVEIGEPKQRRSWFTQWLSCEQRSNDAFAFAYLTFINCVLSYMEKQIWMV